MAVATEWTKCDIDTLKGAVGQSAFDAFNSLLDTENAEYRRTDSYFEVRIPGVYNGTLSSSIKSANPKLEVGETKEDDTTYVVLSLETKNMVQAMEKSKEFLPKTDKDRDLVDMGKGEGVKLKPEDYGSVMKNKAEQKLAVDEVTKDYWSDYYGGYGKELTKDLALTGPKSKSAGSTSPEWDLLEKIQNSLGTEDTLESLVKALPSSEVVEALEYIAVQHDLRDDEGNRISAKKTAEVGDAVAWAFALEFLSALDNAHRLGVELKSQMASAFRPHLEKALELIKMAMVELEPLDETARYGSKTATNEGGTPPLAEEIFADSQDHEKLLPPATGNTVMWVDDIAMHGDRIELKVAWDKSLADCTPKQLEQHVKTFVQEVGTLMEKNWGIIADIQVIEISGKKAVVSVKSAHPADVVPEVKLNELR
jgi:hypothetical protein